MKKLITFGAFLSIVVDIFDSEVFEFLNDGNHFFVCPVISLNEYEIAGTIDLAATPQL